MSRPDNDPFRAELSTWQEAAAFTNALFAVGTMPEAGHERHITNCTDLPQVVTDSFPDPTAEATYEALINTWSFEFDALGELAKLIVMRAVQTEPPRQVDVLVYAVDTEAIPPEDTGILKRRFVVDAPDILQARRLLASPAPKPLGPAASPAFSPQGDPTTITRAEANEVIDFVASYTLESS